MSDRHFVFPIGAAIVVRSALSFMLHGMQRDLRLRRVPARDRAQHVAVMADVERLIAELDAGGVPGPAEFAHGARH